MVKQKKIKFRADSCVYFDGVYCSKIAHTITNGWAEISHCSKCKFFKERVKKENGKTR